MWTLEIGSKWGESQSDLATALEVKIMSWENMFSRIVRFIGWSADWPAHLLFITSHKREYMACTGM